MEQFLKLFSDLGIPLISIFLTAYATYITITNPKKNETNKLQLYKLYLPMYKIIKEFAGISLDKNDVSNELISKYAMKLYAIAIDNVELLPFSHEEKFDKLYKAVVKNDKDQIAEIMHGLLLDIAKKYNQLRIKLYLPNGGIRNIIKHLSIKEKVNFFIHILVAIAIIYFAQYFLIQIVPNMDINNLPILAILLSVYFVYAKLKI